MWAGSTVRPQGVFPSITVGLGKKSEPPPKQRGSHREFHFGACWLLLMGKAALSKHLSHLPPHLLRHSPLQLSELPSISVSPGSKITSQLPHTQHTQSLVFPHPTQNIHQVLLIHQGCLCVISYRTGPLKPRPTVAAQLHFSSKLLCATSSAGGQWNIISILQNKSGKKQANLTSSVMLFWYLCL